jgi:cytochrome c oxidase subunit IV
MEQSHGHTAHEHHTHAHAEAAQHDNHGFDTKAIWRTFWILLVITCIELVVGMFVAPSFPHTTKVWFNILYIIFTAAKAFYIIAEFMHLRHEIKNMIMTIAIPALLFIWFIGAFLWDGQAFRTRRLELDPHHREPPKAQPVTPAHGTEEHLK